MEKQRALTLGEDLQKHYEDTVVVLKSKASLEPYNDTTFINTEFTFLYFPTVENLAEYIYDYIYKDTSDKGIDIRYSLSQNEIKLFDSNKNSWANFQLFDNIMFQNVKTALNLKLSKIPGKYKIEEAALSPLKKKKKTKNL